MAQPTLHHASLIVDDIERTAAFYVDVLDAEWRLKPMRLEPPDAGVFLGGPEELVFDVAMLGFGEQMLELFHFPQDPKPAWLRANGGYVPHLAFHVDDTEARVERALAAGAERLWPEPMSWGQGRVMYLADPEGNAIELIDVPARTLVADCLEMFPELAP